MGPVIAREREEAEELLLAYDDYRASWLPSEIMIWCVNDYKKFKLSKNAFGKETLYLLTNSNWKRVPNAKINGYAITWREQNQTIELDHIKENRTFCEGTSPYTCRKAKKKVRDEFINIWKKHFHPSMALRDFGKYFEITSTSDITHTIYIDDSFYSSRYENNIQKISVTISKNVPNPPNGLRRQTVDEYAVDPGSYGFCRLVE